MLKHFLTTKSLSSATINALLQRALFFKHHPHALPSYPSITLATLFYENSTRTRISFELAAKKLAMQVIHYVPQQSSESKGETLLDTIQNLAAMGIQLFAIRHHDNELPRKLAETVKDSCQIVNAGDGVHEHPSQAMLDVMTIVEHKPHLDRLKIAMVGDILHSRVAHSFQWLCATMNVGELVLVAPKALQPHAPHYGRVTESLKDGLDNADVVIGLRMQRERFLPNQTLSLSDFEHYTITPERLAWAKSDAIIMHPGPVNRGVEMSSEVVDSSRSLILTQVSNGVFMRMAILEGLCQQL